MNAVVFLGPSLPLDEARRRLDARYLPPVEQGDVLRALQGRPRVIAIIDGYFDLVPSVWHKEILVALSQGVHVYGAASMGALRAAELCTFGMVGVGEVFRAFADGELEDDDEVAVMHGPPESGFTAYSVAMVDIRDALVAAAGEGIIDVGLAGRLTVAAKLRHYSDRGFRQVLAWGREHGEDERALSELAAFLAVPRLGQKSRDAIALLDEVDRFLALDPPPLRVPWSLERTYFLKELERDVTDPARAGS